ncbi:DNA polymerase [Candidatus Dojkabacteria bacterium]|jgi:DNA polymerase-1|nr:DNA polymerase [Candidatus Dojkabacteria bacterium]
MLIWKEPTYRIVQNSEQLDALCLILNKAIKDKVPVSIDVETTGPFPESGLDYYYGWLLGISLCVDKEVGYYIPLAHTQNGVLREDQLSIKEVAPKLNDIFSTDGIYLGHNIKFDYKFLWQAGIKLHPVFWDTSIAIQLINGDNFKTRALKKVIPTFVEIPEGVVQTFSDVAEETAAEVPYDILGKYAINDVIFTYYLYQALKPIIDSKFKKLFYGAEIPLIPVLAHIELRGVRIDAEYFKTLKEPLLKYQGQIEKFVESKYGISIGSSLQLSTLLSTKFKDVYLPKTLKGRVSVDEKALNTILKTNTVSSEVYKIAKRTLTHRGIAKAIGTYADKFPKIADIFYEGDNVSHIIHTDFDQIKNSGRLSSAPNIQNLPRDVGVDIRRGFIPREGCCFVEADYSSEELRITTCVSGEQKMLDAYLKDPRGADLHTLTACGIFDVEVPTKEQRHVGKTINFSLLYGATEYSISKTLNCDLAEAKGHVAMYYQTYPGILKWKQEEERKIIERRYVETLFGRRRYLADDIYPGMQEHWKYEAAVRQLINTIIQGTCADILKFTMVKLTKAFAKLEEENEGLIARIVATSHDSITTETNNPELIEKTMRENMEFTIRKILMPVDITVKHSFSSKKYKEQEEEV